MAKDGYCKHLGRGIYEIRPETSSSSEDSEVKWAEVEVGKSSEVGRLPAGSYDSKSEDG
jgi:hypothetical protein